MDEINWLQVSLRWVHIGSAIIMAGGSFFVRFVLMPAAAQLPQAEHDALRARIMATWKRYVMLCIGLLLLSGLVNLMMTVKSVGPIWHGLLLVKIILALVVFFIASALVGRSKGLEPIRQQAGKWLSINLALVLVIVLVSGLMRYIPRKAAGQVGVETSSVR